MISVYQAREIILKNILPLKKSELIKIESALGRVCALEVRSKENIPPFDNSAMDGFAIKASDSHEASRGNPKIFKVIEDVAAGYTAKKELKSGEAIRIMTGAPLPKGADSVVMVEDTELVHSPQSTVHRKKEFVKIFKEIKKGENVRYSGEDVEKGEVVVKKGLILKSGYIGMLASLGFSKVKVFRRPRVAILATGDELVQIKEGLKPGKIRNSNSYSLYSQALKAGALPILLGIARDNRKDLESKIREGLSADILIVSGGVSVGDYDFVKDVLKDLGTDMKFWRVAMKPGKPLAFGMMKSVPVFGLPGNPVSSMIAFEQFARPAVLKLSGARDLFRFRLPAIFTEDFEKKKGLRYFLRVILANKGGQLYASLTGPQGSGILKSMVLANGIAELPEDVEFIRKGKTVEVTYLE